VPVEGDAGKVACSAERRWCTELRGGNVSKVSDVKPSGAGASLGGVGVGASGGSLESSEDWQRRWASGIRERRAASNLHM